MLEHGGRLQRAAAQFGIPAADWLDLSTGINPVGWPVPAVPADVWQRLPEEEDALPAAAAAYYGSDALLAVPGSQWAIENLPALWPSCRVGVLAPSYAEHALRWQQAGHRLTALEAHVSIEELADFDVVVLVNPNNPTARLWPREALQALAARLAGHGGWLVVDEAFMDASAEHSLLAEALPENVVVLRSLGKFFGLAGVRLGFVFAAEALLGRLRRRLSPWAVSHPARWVASRALTDSAWQAHNRQWLATASARLSCLLKAAGLVVEGMNPMFQWLRHDRALEIYRHLAGQGILIRHFADSASLRFGLAATEEEWLRLQAALARL